MKLSIMKHAESLIAIILIFGCFSSIACSKKRPIPPDTIPPVVSNVISIDTTKVLISFNEKIRYALLSDSSNYLITSYETLDIYEVDVDPIRENCMLRTEPQESTYYQINIKNMKDINGNMMNDTFLFFFGIGVPIDSFPPTVYISEPIEGDTLYGFVYFSVGASDNTGVKRVRFYFNDSLISTDNMVPYYTIVDVRNLPEGDTYPIYATAEDYSANIGYSDTHDVFIGFHPNFPYVITDTIIPSRAPWQMDITDDETKLFFMQVYSWTTSCDLVRLDLQTNQINMTLPLGDDGAYYLDVYQNSAVYATNGTSFLEYDIASNQMVNTVDVGAGTRGIIRSNNEKLYIARFTKQDVVVYSLLSNSILDSIQVDGNPMTLSIDTLHNELYVSLFNQRAIDVICTQGDSIITNIPSSGIPFQVIFSSDYSRAYVSESDNNSIGIIETSSHTIIDEFSPTNLVNPKGLALSNDDEHIFITGMSNRLFVVNAFDYSVEWSFTIGDFPYWVAFTPSNDRVFVGCRGTQYGGFGIYCIGY